MKKIGKELLKGVKIVMENEVKKNIYGWPPPCGGILHQPKRPREDDCIRTTKP
jgi:cyclic lactone autoinducer peptide